MKGGGKPPEEIHQRQALFVHFPVDPARLVVLAIRVVVAALGAAEFVAGADHRGALRQNQRSQQIAQLAPPQRLYVSIVGGSLGAAIPGPVVGVAIAIALAIRLVVLIIVGDEVAQGEPVMRGDEIDARPRSSATKVELVGRSAQARRQGFRARLAAPEVAHVIAKPIVPLAPAGRKAAHLISPWATVPRLGDKFDFREKGVLSNRLEKAALGIKSVGLTRENCAEIEAESVHSRFANPVTQAVHDHLYDPGMAEVERVTGARVIDVEARLVGHEPVVRLVVDAFERKRRPTLIPLGSMIVDDVEDHLETAVMKPGDHFLEFAQRVRYVRGVTRVWREKADRIVTPIIAKSFLEQIAVVDESVDGHEFDGRDAERLDVVDNRFRTEACIKAFQPLVDFWMQLREPLDVRLVDDGAFPGNASPQVLAAPVEIRIDDDGFRHEGRAVAFVE